MKIIDLQERFAKAWCKETAYHQEWDNKCPAYNQCCPTALVAQDYLGGDILWADLGNDDKHYWNLLPDGSWWDFTEEQFFFMGIPNPAGKKGRKANRKSLLRIKNVRQRYEILLNRISKDIGVASHDGAEGETSQEVERTDDETD